MLGAFAEPDFQSLAADAWKYSSRGLPSGRVELRIFFRRGGVQLDLDIALCRRSPGCSSSACGNVFEELDHFLGRLEIDFLGILHPVLVEDHLAGADADHDIVRGVVGAVEEMHVVGGDGFDVILFAPIRGAGRCICAGPRPRRR